MCGGRTLIKMLRTMSRNSTIVSTKPTTGTGNIAARAEPWSQIHYAGPFDRKFWLVVIDAFSKWLKIRPQSSTTSANTIKLLREILFFSKKPLYQTMDHSSHHMNSRRSVIVTTSYMYALHNTIQSQMV